jgi:hypothetical protein
MDPVCAEPESSGGFIVRSHSRRSLSRRASSTFLRSSIFDFQRGSPLPDLVFQVSVGFPKVLFRFLALLVFLRFRKGPLDGRREPVDPVLHDIILGSAGEDFYCPVLADGTGHEDKGDVQASAFCLGKGQYACVCRKIIVGKDYVRRKCLKRMDKILFPRQHVRGKDDPHLLQFELNELGIGRVIFQDENSEGLIHVSSFNERAESMEVVDRT